MSEGMAKGEQLKHNILHFNTWEADFTSSLPQHQREMIERARKGAGASGTVDSGSAFELPVIYFPVFVNHSYLFLSKDFLSLSFSLFENSKAVQSGLDIAE